MLFNYFQKYDIISLIQKDDPRLKIPCEEVVDFENKEFYQNLINQIVAASVNQYAFAAAAHNLV